MAAAEPMIPLVAQAPERIQEPVKAKGSRARTHTPRPVQPRAKSKPKTPTRAHTPPPAPKSSEIDMTDPTVEPQPPKKRAQSAGAENEPQADSSKKPRANSRKRGRSTSRTAEIQVIPVPKSSRSASNRKKAKDPTDGAGPELAKALTEHYVIGGWFESRARAESTPVGQRTRTPSRPRRASSVAAETPFLAPHVAPLATAAAELEEDVIPHLVATPKRVSFKDKHKVGSRARSHEAPTKIDQDVFR